MILTFPIDRSLRKQIFVEASFEHPAQSGQPVIAHEDVLVFERRSV